MAVRSLKNSTLENFANYSSSMNAGYSFQDYELIESVFLASNAASISFNNLNQYANDYKHLQLRVVGRDYWSSGSATGSNLLIEFNSTSTTYKGHFLNGNGSSVGSGEFSNASFDRIPISTSTSSSEFGAFVLDILDAFSTTKNKTMRSLGGMTFSYGNWIELASGAWFSTNQITSLQVISNAGVLGSGSRFSLYGIR